MLQKSASSRKLGTPVVPLCPSYFGVSLFKLVIGEPRKAVGAKSVEVEKLWAAVESQLSVEEVEAWVFDFLLRICGLGVCMDWGLELRG